MAAAFASISPPDKILQIIETSGVFKGRELTRKDRRLISQIPAIDALLGGGIPRGRISEIVGRQSSGKTSIAASFMASAARRGEVVGLVDGGESFDPMTMSQAGVDLERTLWVHPGNQKNLLRAAELILEAGGFGLVVVDFGLYRRALTQSSALRLARWAERSGAGVLIIADFRMCGTFSALTLCLKCNRPLLSRLNGIGPALFDGLSIDAVLARNKLGPSGGRAQWRTAFEPSDRGSALIPSSTSEFGPATLLAERA